MITADEATTVADAYHLTPDHAASLAELAVDEPAARVIAAMMVLADGPSQVPA